MTSARTRLSCLLLLASSVALAVYAQYLFERPKSFWYDSIILYALAMLIFIRVIRPLWSSDRPPPGRDPGTKSRLGVTLSVDGFGRGLVILGALAAGEFANLTANQVPAPSSYNVALAFWLVSLLAFTCAFVPWSGIPGSVRAVLKGRRRAIERALPEVAIISAILLIGFMLRAYSLASIPANFGGDEGEVGVEARRFLAASLPNMFSTGWAAQATMFFFLQSLVMRVFGSTVFGLRFFSVLLGTLSLLWCYLLVRVLHGKRLAAMTGFLLAFYPLHIHYSRLALMSIGDVFWAALIMLLVIQAVNTRRTFYYLLAGFALGASLYFYIAARLVLIILIIYLAYWFLQERERLLSQTANFVIMGAAAVLMVLPLLGYYAGHFGEFLGRFQTVNILSNGWLAQRALESGQSQLAIMLDRTRESLLVFNSVHELSTFYYLDAPLLDSISAILFVFGLAYALYRFRNRDYLLFLLLLFGCLFFGYALVLQNGSARLLTTTLPVMFFVALGLNLLVESAGRLLRLRPRRTLYAASIAVIFIAGFNTNLYFSDYTPRRTYSSEGAWRLTEVAKLFLAEKEPYKVYYFGAPYEYLNNGIIRYMVPGLDGMDVQHPLDGPPDFVDGSRRAIFVFHPAREGEFEYVRSEFPKGEETDYWEPDGFLLFRMYVVDNPNPVKNASQSMGGNH